MENEQWKDIDGYEGLYKVSSYGYIKSLSRTINGRWGTQSIKERILKARIDKDGYSTVALYKNGKAKQEKIHRLVAKAFLKKIGGKEIINHINNDPSCNLAENLEWCTNKENQIASSISPKGKRINATGFVGVIKHKNRFRAVTKNGGKKIYIGCYSTPEEANKAYMKYNHLDELNNLRNTVKQFSVSELKEMIAEYNEKLNNL